MILTTINGGALSEQAFTAAILALAQEKQISVDVSVEGGLNVDAVQRDREQLLQDGLRPLYQSRIGDWCEEIFGDTANGRRCILRYACEQRADERVATKIVARYEMGGH